MGGQLSFGQCQKFGSVFFYGSPNLNFHRRKGNRGLKFGTQTKLTLISSGDNFPRHIYLIHICPWDKSILTQNRLWTNIFPESKFVQNQLFLTQNYLDPHLLKPIIYKKLFNPKNFSAKNVFSQVFFRPKFFYAQKFCSTKTILNHKFFCHIFFLD